MGYGLSFWPVPIFAAIQTNVAASFGTPNDYIWFIPSWSLAITVSFLIAGPNTDLLGRRWFLVGGNLICLVGHLVIATAKSAGAVTAGMTIVGLGAANCQMAAFALSELLPNKWRHLGVVLADLTTLIAVTVSPVTARFGMATGSWAWNFYAAAIFQGLSFLGLFFLYYPPAHPTGLSYSQAFKELDYIGMILFIAGAAPFLAGIIYTTILSSTDLHVVLCLVVGVVILVLFALWENLGSRWGWIKHPLTPTRVFTAGRGRDFTAPCIATAIINMFYYSTSIIYPTMIAVWWTNGTGWQHPSLLSIVQGLAITTGVAFLSFFGSRIKHWNWQLTGYATFMVFFGALLALAAPDRMGMTIAFVFLSQAGYSPAMYLCIAVTQMGVEQKDLGLSGGVGGTARFAGGAIATSVYQTILTNTVNTWTAKLVPAAAIAAGLSESDVAALLPQVGTTSLAENYSAAVVSAVDAAVVQAYQHGFQVTALASIAFGVVGIIACALCRDIDPKMTDKIEVYMENNELIHKHEKNNGLDVEHKY
ncbi:fungal trichothecene efflux pump [Xylariales sp. PMI_506]|nr:fungal trichothecene efflux pump [Xylariales sp. PMI_506]